MKSKIIVNLYKVKIQHKFCKFYIQKGLKNLILIFILFAAINQMRAKRLPMIVTD